MSLVPLVHLGVGHCHADSTSFVARTHAGFDGKQGTEHEQKSVLHHLHEATTPQQCLHCLRQGEKSQKNTRVRRVEKPEPKVVESGGSEQCVGVQRHGSCEAGL